MVAYQEIRLNEALIVAYDYDKHTRVIDGANRRVWCFELVATGEEQKDSLNQLLEEPELTLTIADEQARVRKGDTSYNYDGSHHSPGTKYHYNLELIELLEGEKPPESTLGFVLKTALDISTALFDGRMQRYEERLREIETRLGIDNQEHIRVYEERIDQAAEEGWLTRWPEFARDLKAIAHTPRVKELLKSLDAKEPRSDDAVGRPTELSERPIARSSDEPTTV